MESLDLKQSDLETNMKQVKNEIENIHADRDMVILDVDAIKELCGTKLQSIDRIDEAVEKIERNSNKSKIRIFGLKSPDSPTSLKSFVIESFLKVARPDQQWNESCISNIYQVGNKSKPLIFLSFRTTNLNDFCTQAELLFETKVFVLLTY